MNLSSVINISYQGGGGEFLSFKKRKIAGIKFTDRGGSERKFLHKLEIFTFYGYKFTYASRYSAVSIIHR